MASAAAVGIKVASSGTLLEYKGWLYKTAHDRQINGKELSLDGQNEKMAPDGWDLCMFDADVVTVCRLFPWSSSALVLLDGSTCLTAACSEEAGKPGEIRGRNYLKTDYSKRCRWISSDRKTCDILLRKRGCLGDEAAPVAAAASTSGMAVPAVASHANESTITQELRAQGWRDDYIHATMSHFKNLGKVYFTVVECKSYLEKYYPHGTRSAVAPVPAQSASSPFGSAPARASSTAGAAVSQTALGHDQLRELMLSMGYQKLQVDSAFRAGYRDMESCVDYIAKYCRGASPPPPAKVDPADSRSLHLETALSLLLCAGATPDHQPAAFLTNTRLTRQELDATVETYEQINEPVQQLYRCHARCGIQAALYLCHPSFASDDDLMVAAAQKAITAEVLVPLQKAGWDVCPAFRSLWGGDRDFILSDSARQLVEVTALREHSHGSIASLPLAFPFVYAETIAIYMACKDPSQSQNTEAKKILEVIREGKQSSAALMQMLRLADAPHLVKDDGPLSSQFSGMLARAEVLKQFPSYSPELKHFRTAEVRRQNRCLCLCSAHLVIQSKKLYSEGKIAGKLSNPLQFDIDKLVCVALSANLSVGNWLSNLFETPPYSTPTISSQGQSLEMNLFYSDFLALIQSEQVHQALAECFDTHLKWLLDAASGAIALTQSMLLDASSHDEFAKAVLERAACLRSPVIAATTMANSIGPVSLQEEKNEIKQLLSDFEGVGPALDRFWGLYFDPTLPVSTSARANPDLVKISVKSARWLLALDRTWLKKNSEIKEMLLKLPISTAGGQIFPRLLQWSVWLQEEFIRRVVNLIKNREACDRDTSSKKLIDGTTEQELQFFSTVAVPRLVEAGFTQIPTFIEALQTIALQRQCQLPDNLVDQIPYGSAAPANMCWIDQFKKIWRNARM